MQTETKFTVEIRYTHPIELMDFTRGFLSIGDEYRRYVKQHTGSMIVDDVRLFIKGIRPGSIITDLVALSQTGLPFMEHSVTILDFTKYLMSAVTFLTGASDTRPPFTKLNLENLTQILETIAKDNTSQIFFQTIINGNVEQTFNVNSLEAKAAQQSATRELQSMKDPVTGYHEMVVLYWYQARNDMTGATGDKAIIESISRTPVKTICATPETKAQMIRDEGNFFKTGFLVDVKVETINDKPVLYKITHVHEPIDLPEGVNGR